MAIKKIKIVIRSLKESFEKDKRFFADLDRGIFRKCTPTISFENFEIYKKTFTPKRIELLQIIKYRNPKTIKELSIMAGRDFKNVYSDLKLFKMYDLVKLKKTSLGLMPVIYYDRIELDIKIPLAA